jgi:release factor glutamine methyltransferase
VTGPTIHEALAAATGRLRLAGSPTPSLDAEVLLAHAIGRDRSWLHAHPEAPMGDAASYDGLVVRRAAGEPVAYIRGFKEWHSLRIRTDPRALIPRPETELLADTAVAEIDVRRSLGPVVAWEVGTGSGAVMTVLAHRFGAAPDITLIATDISADALALARENLVEHGVADAVRLAEADLLSAQPADLPAPNVIVANLPYVASAEVDERAGSLGFEPRIAVDGGPDGLVVLRRLFDALPEAARSGATVLLELGVDQVDAVRELVPAGATVSVVPDLAGLDRVIRIRMAD